MSVRLILAVLAAAVPSSIAAQAVVQPLGPTEADLLAGQMRRLAADPRNLDALASAGELSLRVGDLSGAAALFARADKVDPRSGRVKAGMASILVRSERPGEALRFFAQAESYGWPAARFAADRGLAYDLIGEQERAQRDYRLALKAGSDDETTRRYALSLGISGRQAQALDLLDPLIRRQDRPAWRARAFVLAMGGDTAAAAKIGTAMMPATMAQGLGAFFGRLPALGPVDRAFAVHFGEVYATPERIADARLTPALVPLTPEPGLVRPVQVAAAEPVRDRRSRRERERDRRAGRDQAPAVAVAQTPVVTRQPSVLADARTARSPSTIAPRPIATPGATPAAREPDVRIAVASTSAVPTPTRPPVAIAALPPRPPGATTGAAPSVTGGGLASAPLTDRAASGVPPQSTGLAVASVAPVASPPTGVVAASTVSSAIIGSGGQPVGPGPVERAGAAVSVGSPGAAPVTVAAVPAPDVGASTRTPTTAPPPSVAVVPVVATAQTASAAVPTAAPAVPVAPVTTAAATDRADSVLARIVASLSIPASELDVPPLRSDAKPTPDPAPVPAVVTRAPVSPAGRRVVAEASAKEARDASLRRTVAARLTGNPEADEPRGRAARAKDAPLDPKARRAATAKALADRKAAEEKKAIAAKEAAEKKVARARPARIWVQVAGGAREADLPKAWRAAQAKASALKGRAGYSTPLRATNRVLTGPFKTDAEARAMVNQLAKQGVSAFSFTSEAGQDVKTLGK